jgi:hypothetical protein
MLGWPITPTAMNRPVALFLAQQLLTEVEGSEFAYALDRWIVDNLHNGATEEHNHADHLPQAA